MPAQIFTDLLQQAQLAGHQSIKSTAARDWFRDAAREVTRSQVTPQRLVRQSTDNLSTRAYIGRMYFFFYDPKYKNELPYYDTFPLIFPIGQPQNGKIMGLNMHYLGYIYRARLMDALHATTNNKRYNETTRLKITYDILNSSARYKYFKPCVKQYLLSNVRSKFVEVPAQNWETALFLPVEQFKKATKQQVFTDSRKKIAGN